MRWLLHWMNPYTVDALSVIFWKAKYLCLSWRTFSTNYSSNLLFWSIAYEYLRRRNKAD